MPASAVHTMATWPTPPTSPTVSRARSSASGASSSSGSIRGSTCSRWSSAARPSSVAPPPRRRSRASARESWTRSGPYVVAVKPQAAFFEALGSDGIRALEDVCAYARGTGLLVLLDAKRNDIGSTARAYSAAYLEPNEDGDPLADAMTATPYLGLDSLEPFLAACRRHGSGVFLLVRTSNAGAADVQDAILSDGRPLWQHLATLVHEWGRAAGRRGRTLLGRRRRRRDLPARRVGGAPAMPQTPILLPGVGAQGATPADVARAFTSGPASALVTVSRSVIYAFKGTDDDWRAAAAAEAERLSSQVWSASGW